jgi:Uma2 family endonuclease
LVVEVAETSLRKDRGIKALLYAACEVPEYWLVNVEDGSVEVHSEPASGRYTRMTTHRAGEELVVRAFPDVRVAVADILPPR